MEQPILKKERDEAESPDLKKEAKDDDDIEVAEPA